MSDARPNFFDFDVTKMFADFRFRPFDVEAMWAAQRRNIEALSQANQLAMESVQAVARRQIELTRETFEGFSALLRDITQPVSPEDKSRGVAFCAGAALATAVNVVNAAPARIYLANRCETDI